LSAIKQNIQSSLSAIKQNIQSSLSAIKVEVHCLLLSRIFKVDSPLLSRMLKVHCPLLKRNIQSSLVCYQSKIYEVYISQSFIIHGSATEQDVESFYDLKFHSSLLYYQVK